MSSWQVACIVFLCAIWTIQTHGRGWGVLSVVPALLNLASIYMDGPVGLVVCACSCILHVWMTQETCNAS